METLQRTANRGSISTATSFDIDNSCKFEKSNSETMYRQQVNGDRRTWTSSFWIKFCGGTGSGTDTHMLYHGVYGQGTRIFTSGGTDQLYIDLCSTGNERYRWITNRVFRDRSAWYHIVWRVDTTQSSLSNRMRLYVNGEQITDWQKEADDSDNDSSNSGNKMPQDYQTLANYDHGGYDKMQFSYKEASIYANMYIAEFHHCDGYSYAPTEFGESDSATGIWKPIEPSVSYGNSGCHLDFKDSSNLGNDANGGTDFTLQNISAADQATDTPTNNFCILNNLDQRPDTPTVMTEGATVNVQDPGSGTGSVRGTMGVSSGKWYWEFQLDLFEGAFYYLYGVSSLEKTQVRYPGQGDGGFSIGVYAQGGNAFFNGSNTAWETSGVGADGDIIGIFMDLDNETLKVQKNGTFIGNVNNDIMALTGISANFDKTDYTGAFADGTNSTAYRTRFLVNFGGYCAYTISSGNSDANGYGNFEYSPNDGTYDYYSLCTKNIAEYG